MRAHIVGALCIAALLAAGCAKKDPQLTKIEGSEPQRLSFGNPEAVRVAFAGKMKACWFDGTYPLLGGYQYDAQMGVIQAANGPAEVEQITISSGKGENAQVFVVQFSSFNDNTLISTRSTSFPPELAQRMKRDVETWIFGRDDCGGSGGPGAFVPPQQNAMNTQQSAPRLQQASLPDEGDDAPRGTVSPSRATLSRAPN